MIAANTFKGKTVALFGLGGSGLATAKALQAGGANVIAWDDNPDSVARAEAEGVPTRDLREIDWSSVASFVLSPGVPLTHPKPHWTVGFARNAGVEIIGDVEIFVRERRAQAPDCPFIAITGTNGKSTTTALIAHILQASGRDTQLGGNIGRAVLTLDPPKDGRFFVVECSSYQIDLAPTLNPTAGILLNLTPDHLDRHGTMQHYAEVKERLVAGAKTAIVGTDDSYCELIGDRVERAGTKVIRISKAAAARRWPLCRRLAHHAGRERSICSSGRSRWDPDAARQPQCPECLRRDCRLPGSRRLGRRDPQGPSELPGLKHRMQPVGRRRHVVFVNDSKATNADAAAPALSSYERIYWIAGGLPKEGGIASLAPLFPRIVKAYLIGEAASAFAAQLGDRVAYEISDHLERAVGACR